MPPRPLRVAAATLASALAVAGCGNSAPTKSERAAAAAKQTVRTALLAVAHDDGRAFCALLTPGAQAALGRILYGYDCPHLATMIGRHLWPEARTALLHARVTAVTLGAGGASATVSSDAITAARGSVKGLLDDHGTPTRLVRTAAGDWLIAADG
ncbi:MAG: hypothetical protein ACRDMJ_10785 [Solirubrobacteraceae bacterium]